MAVKDSTGDFQGISRLMSEAPRLPGLLRRRLGDVRLRRASAPSASCQRGEPSRGPADPPDDRADRDRRRRRPPARSTSPCSPLFNALFVTSNPIPLKAALELVGRPAGVPRLPLVPATSEERDRVRKALEDAGLL